MKFTIRDVRKVPSGLPERFGKFDAIITYQLEGFGVYILTLPAEDLTDEKVKLAVQKDVEERKLWIGKEFEIK